MSDFASVLSAVAQKPEMAFKLTYTAHGSSVQGQVTVEQMPPDQLVKWNTVELLSNGRDSYSCTRALIVSCRVVASSSTGPLESIMTVFSPTTYVDDLKSWQEVVAAGGSGYHISLTRRVFAGQPSECISWDYQASKVKYCVTGNGVLAYAAVSGRSAHSSYSLQLTSYSVNVVGSDFAPPKGATSNSG